MRLEASEFLAAFEEFARSEGTTGADGTWRFEIPLKKAFVGRDVHGGQGRVHVEARVTDGAAHSESKTADVAVTTSPITVAAFPESGRLVPGIPNVVHLLAAYADGRPARARIEVLPVGLAVETADDGLASIEFVPGSGPQRLTLVATDAAGVRATALRTLESDDRQGVLLLRADRPICRVGETLALEAMAPDSTGRVYVDLVQDGRTLLARSVELEGGRARLDVDLPPGAAGLIVAHAYRFMPSGELVGDARLVQVERPDSLSVEARFDRDQYRPGEKAVVRFLVRRADGTPAPAALGVSGVDEAVFALQEMRPGFERIWFLLQEELLRPRGGVYEAGDALDASRPPRVRGALLDLVDAREPTFRPSETYLDRMGRIAGENARYARTTASAASLAPGAFLLLALAPLFVYALRGAPPGGLGGEGRPLRRASAWIGFWWAVAVYLSLVGYSIGSGSASWRTREAFGALGLALGFLAAWIPMVRATVHARRLPAAARAPAWRAVVGLVPIGAILAAGAVAMVRVAWNARLLDEDTAGVATLVAVGSQFLAIGALAAATRAAAEGASTLRRVWTLASRSGAALAPLLFLGVFSSVGAPRERFPGSDMTVQSSLGPKTAASFDGLSAPRPSLEADRSSTPRVRREFPETLFWQPEIITDDRGEATLEVDLADSITTWRVAASAVSAGGELGSTEAGLVVFQDFFCDLDLPASLTRHDRIEVPVAVHNWLDEPQTVQVELASAPWFRLEGSSTRTIELGPREVTSVRFAIEALEPGVHVLSVSARGARVADALERQVRVEPDGRRVETVANGTLRGAAGHDLSFPADAVPGGNDLYLKVYAGGFDQVVEGLDGILRMPYGCFEQTTSVTYPNVLVLDYLRRTGRIAPEIELNAAALVNQGYQRLLTFECEEHGFEWFGRSPANVVLTAYGLMEFVDMARVHDVDPDLIERTRAWLLGQQTGSGEWVRDGRHVAAGAVHARPGEDLRTTAYVAWALARSGATGRGVSWALDRVAAEAVGEADPYTLALCANALAAAGRSDQAEHLVARLEASKIEEGGVHWTSETAGVTCSLGRSLDIECTALAIQAYLATGWGTATAHRALEWLAGTRDAWGTFHSTQATIQSLRALLAASAVRRSGRRCGSPSGWTGNRRARSSSTPRRPTSTGSSASASSPGRGSTASTWPPRGRDRSPTRSSPFTTTPGRDRHRRRRSRSTSATIRPGSRSAGRSRAT